MTGDVSISANDSARRSILGLAAWLGLVFAVAAMGGLFQPGSWYASLHKPSWTPPGWVFGPVWAVLYISMAVAAWLVWRQGGFATQRAPLSLFVAQLVCNALWSPLFFGLRQPGLALLDITLLFMILLATVLVFWKIRLLAGALLVPYLAWVGFASALNFALWKLNR